MKVSKTREEFNKHWNGYHGWNRQYCIYSGGISSKQAEWYMWVAFQAGVRFGKAKGGNNGND